MMYADVIEFCARALLRSLKMEQIAFNGGCSETGGHFFFGGIEHECLISANLDNRKTILGR